MKFNKIGISGLKTIYPNNGIDLKAMDKAELEEYIDLYNTYRMLLSEYLIEKIGLKEYDKKIEDSELNFVKVDEKNMDIYQYFSKNELSYFYIRNNVYVEKLDKKEKEFFKKKLENRDLEIDEETKKILEKTYPKVIFEDVGKDGKRYLMLYGPDSRNYLAHNDCIIIGAYYDEFNLNGMDSVSWDKQHKEQRKYIFNVLNEMQEKIIKDNIYAHVIYYNQFSVIKRDKKTK